MMQFPRAKASETIWTNWYPPRWRGGTWWSEESAASPRRLRVYGCLEQDIEEFSLRFPGGLLV